MRRYLALAALVGAIAVPSAGRATHNDTGSAAVMNPNGAVLWGVTERGALCDPSSPLNGIDGQWYSVNATHRSRPVRVTPTGANAAAQDLNIYFYTLGGDGTCALLSAFGGANHPAPGASESTIVPGSATHMIVDLIIGAAATWTVDWQ